MFFINKRVAPRIICATFALGTAAQAQEVPEPGNGVSGEIVVTAQRRSQSIQAVPQAVQALGGETLVKTGITNLEQSIQLIPSATTGSTVGAGSTTFQIRGVAASETDGDPTVGFYLDNFAFALPGRPFAPAADFYDLQRVEVLRGPSGTLYGLGSLGGTIKVLTNDPDLYETEGSVRVSGAATSGGEPNGSGDLMLNAPLIPGKLAVRGVVSYKMIGGYADALSTGEKDANDASSFTGRVKLLARPTDDLRVQLAYWRNENRQNYANRLTFFDPPATNWTLGESNSNYSLYTADIEYDLGFATLQSSTGYIRNRIYSESGGFIPGSIGDFVAYWPLTTKTFNEDIRLTSDNSGPFRYIVGFYYQDGKTYGGQDTILPDFQIPGNLGIATRNNNELKSKAWAVYGEGTYSLFERKLDLTVGGRYFEERRTFNENSSLELLELGIITPTIETVKVKENTFNPRFNIAFHASDNGMIYVEAAKGFRSGAVTSTSIIAAANLALGTDFSPSSRPDTLWNYEAGVKWSLFDRQLRLALSAYYFDWADAQLELSPSAQTIVVPVGDVRGRGIDAEINWSTPIAGLQLQASGNVNKTTLRGVPDSVTAALPFIANGHQLPGSAKTTFAIAGNYARPITPALEFRASGRYTYRSRQQSIFDGRYAPWIGMGAARIGVGNDDYDLALFADNIGNTRGPLAVPGGQYQVPYPRTIGLALDVKF
ncbi:MAG: TonB-dependent receptor [Sphingomonadaceae bacterium]